jgi:hypothetical protein
MHECLTTIITDFAAGPSTCCLQINGTFKVGGDGSVEFKEEDGIDYAPVTVQLPGEAASKQAAHALMPHESCH